MKKNILKYVNNHFSAGVGELASRDSSNELDAQQYECNSRYGLEGSGTERTEGP